MKKGNKTKNPFNYFDAIYCINLDRRRDRWLKVQQEFKKLKIQKRVIRFSAFDTPKNGYIGCMLSHLAIIKHAELKKFKNILIFEDDILVMQTKGIDVNIAQLKRKKWDIFYFGGIFDLAKCSVIKENGLLKISGLWCMHAIALNKSFFPIILKELDQENIINGKMPPIDDWMIQKQSEYAAYASDELFIIQTRSDSDIGIGSGFNQRSFIIRWHVAKYPFLKKLFFYINKIKFW